MPYGWVGTNLEIDLTQGSIEKVKGDPEMVNTYLGGKGTNAKILWDRVGPEVDPFSPDNLLIIGTGILTGTMVPYANRAVITFRSPVTGLQSYSALGGFWPAEIKHAGYDAITINGRSPTPVYLWINNDQVELRDAGHLSGKSTFETRRIIREELQNDKVQIACIGPAGENKVYGASVQSTAGASCSRSGIGALWGDKKLKAIAVYGTKDVNVADPTRLFELSQRIMDRSDLRRGEGKRFLRRINRAQLRDVWYGNYNEAPEEFPPDSELVQALENIEENLEELIKKNHVRYMGCYNCMAPCRAGFVTSHGEYVYFKCSSLLAFMVNTKNIDHDFGLEAFGLCEEYGLDILASSRCIAFAIDLYEKGILTKADTDGMHLEWGNQEIVFSLMKKMTQREGFGDVLANGIYRAAQQIGRGAEEYTHLTKKLPHPLPSTWFISPYFALIQAVNDKADCSRQMTGVTQRWAFRGRKVAGHGNDGEQADKETYIKDGWFQHPQEYEKYYMTEFSEDGTDREPGCQFAAYDDEALTITDVIGTCNFTSVFSGYQPITTRAQMADLVSAATGLDIDETGLTKIAGRIVNLVRATNLRFGARRKDDTLPKVYFKKTPVPPRRKLHPDTLNKWVDRYYELKGWNKEGIPTKKTLEKYGLDYVRQELEQRKILTEKGVLTT